MKTKKYWYFITFSECPMCGKSEETRERRHNFRPVKKKDRVRFIQDTVCASYDVANF